MGVGVCVRGCPPVLPEQGRAVQLRPRLPEDEGEVPELSHADCLGLLHLRHHADVHQSVLYS